MSRAKWGRHDLGDGWWYCIYRLSESTGYIIDGQPGKYSTQFLAEGGEQPVGPLRKTLRAAHNDCKRHAKKLRAALVEFDRAKLP